MFMVDFGGEALPQVGENAPQPPHETITQTPHYPHLCRPLSHVLHPPISTPPMLAGRNVMYTVSKRGASCVELTQRTSLPPTPSSQLHSPHRPSQYACVCVTWKISSCTARRPGRATAQRTHSVPSRVPLTIHGPGTISLLRTVAQTTTPHAATSAHALYHPCRLVIGQTSSYSHAHGLIASPVDAVAIKIASLPPPWRVQSRAVCARPESDQERHRTRFSRCGALILLARGRHNAGHSPAGCEAFPAARSLSTRDARGLRRHAHVGAAFQRPGNPAGVTAGSVARLD